MHPVFDSLTFPRHLPEVNSFYLILCQVYQKENEPEDFYSQCGALITELPSITANQNIEGKWIEALQNLSQRGKLKKLCEILQQSAENDAVKNAIAVIMGLKSAVDPEAVESNLVILDRNQLREQLVALAKESDPVKVVLIKGNEKSGKTYSRHLFEAMARQRGASMVYLHSFVVVNLADVVNDLFVAAGNKNAIPAGDTTVPGWHAKICRELFAVASEKQKEIWIAIDDLGFITDKETGTKTDLMDKEIRDFFIQFVRHMSDQGFRKHFRLMLINYPPGKIPAGWFKEHYREDDLKEDDITQAHIEELVASWSRARQKNILPDELSKSAKEIIDNCKPVVEPDDAPRLQQINDGVINLLNRYQLITV